MKKELLIFGSIVVVLSTIVLIALFSRKKEVCKCLEKEVVDAPSATVAPENFTEEPNNFDA